MKKIITLIISFGLLLTLTGCFYNYDETMSFKETYEVIDLSDEFNFHAESINIYENSNDPYVPYVNMDEFLEVIKEAVLETETESRIEYLIFYIMEQDGVEYHIRLSFNPESNTFHCYEYNYGKFINRVNDLEVDTNIEMIDYQYDGTYREIFIDLDDYDIDVLFDKDGHYIPLYLANQLLTGDYLTSYHENEKLYLFTDATKLLDVIEETESEELNNPSFMIEDNYNFTRLLFDYFYGLKDFKEIDDMTTYINEFNLSDSETITEFHENFFKMIVDLQDNHTYVLDQGMYELEDSDYFAQFSDEFYNSLFYSLIGNGCYADDREVVELIEYDTGRRGIYVLQVDEFNENTPELVKTEMAKAIKDFDIYIDLRCNTGGLLSTTLDLLTYITEDNFQVNYHIPSSKESFTETYTYKENYKVDNFVYVLTSHATFSAANLFASVVKDYSIAPLIGDGKTSGGGAAIDYGVLPDGTLFSYSSNLLLRNNEDEVIEDGIEIDLNIGTIDNIVMIDKQITDLANDYSNPGYTVDFELGRISIEIDNTFSDEVEFIEYEVKVYDNDYNILIEETIDTESFATLLIYENTSSYNIVDVNVYFKLDGVTYKANILNGYVD